MNRQRKIFTLAATLGFIAACMAVFLIDPHGPHRGILPGCVFRGVTGLYCPGCGATRAAHSLMHGRLLEAIRYNPLLVFFGVPAFALSAIAFFRNQKRYPTSRRGKAIGWSILTIALVYSIARNLPSSRFDALRPPEDVQMSSNSAPASA